MLPTPTGRTTAAELGTGIVMFTGPATVTEAEVGGLLLTTPAAVLAVTSTAVDVLAVVGMFVWVVALLVLVVGDVSHAAQRVRLHPHDRHPRMHHTHQHRHVWARR